MHEVIEANAVLEKVVYASHDTEDTKREDPDTDDSDDRCVMVCAMEEPSEEGEEGCQEIDGQDSTGQLP